MSVPDGRGAPLAERAESLEQALNEDFPAIEAGIRDFLALHGGEEAATESLRTSIAALRRHIYIEQEFVLSHLQRAGDAGPVRAMSADHQDLWFTMDRMEQVLADDAAPRVQQETCRILMAQLDEHSSREDPVVFKHIAEVLTPADEAALRDAMAHATLPVGWSCADGTAESA